MFEQRMKLQASQVWNAKCGGGLHCSKLRLVNQFSPERLPHLPHTFPFQASLQVQLDALRKQSASDIAAQEEQHLSAARSLEDKVRYK